MKKCEKEIENKNNNGEKFFNVTIDDLYRNSNNSLNNNNINKDKQSRIIFENLFKQNVILKNFY